VNGTEIWKGATPRPFIGANDRGVAPKDDLPENPARWAGLGKRTGLCPSFKSVNLLLSRPSSADSQPAKGAE